MVVRAGALRVHAFGGTDGKGGGAGPAVVLCHGFGAPGDDLVGLGSSIPTARDVRWFFPEAPLEIDFGFGQTGRAWWPIDMMALQEAMLRGRRDALADATPDGMFEARDALGEALMSLEATHGLDPSRTIVGGFSQGSMVTTELTLFGARRYAGLVVLSGTLLCRDRWEAAARERLAAFPILMTHGRRDPILPFAWAEAMREVFERNQAALRWVAHGGAHEIPRLALEGLATFVNDVLSPDVG
jgi:phospholipase/carboxylesterase